MKVKTQTTYVAYDGTVFNTPNECQTYENSKLSYYKRIAVEQEFMSYNPDYNVLSSCSGEDSDLTEELKMYACRIIYDALEMKDKGSTLNEIMIEFGLIVKE